MNEPIDIRMRELLWRRELTDAEQAELRRWLESHPNERADWETERLLSAGLNRMPDAPMPSNFTARVMQAVEKLAAAEDKHPEQSRAWIWRRLIPRVAVVAIVIAGGVFLHERSEGARAAELAQSLKTVTQVESLPSPSTLEDFDAIRRMGKTAPVDQELLALLQ